VHTLSWAAWVTLVMSVALSTSNPLYLVVVLLCVCLVAALAPRTAQAVAGFRALALLGVGLLVISTGIAVVNGSYGEHELFTVPGPEVPDWLGGLSLGGPVAAEGLVAAVLRSLAILCVFLAFAVFNGAVSPSRILRSAPAALFHAGLVVTVGLALLPASVDDVRRIREMRALRGARTGVRDLPALLVPAVIGGLERSMRLAEAMEARGYAAAPATGRWPRLMGALSAPLFLAAAWVWFYYERYRAFAAVAALVGVVALVAWALLAARGRSTTRLRPEPLALSDRAGIALSIALTALTVVGKAAGWLDLSYNPFAGLEWPGFSPGGAAIALACAWPALLLLTAPAPGTEGDTEPLVPTPAVEA